MWKIIAKIYILLIIVIAVLYILNEYSSTLINSNNDTNAFIAYFVLIPFAVIINACSVFWYFKSISKDIYKLFNKKDIDKDKK